MYKTVLYAATYAIVSQADFIPNHELLYNQVQEARSPVKNA